MPFLRKPIAFDSINFQPGFPSLSVFSCNPWDTSRRLDGACASEPVQIARQQSTMPASFYIQRALIEAGAAPAAVNNMMKRGIVPAALAGIAGIRPQLRGLGWGGDGGSIGDGNTGATRLGGCGCGGKTAGGCGCGGHGLGDFSLTDITSDPMAWLKSNVVPLTVGAAVAYFVFKKR
jgi:hypothetical protein